MRLAFKLSKQEANDLITNGKAKSLKYFSKGHVKKGYALFENPETKKATHWKKYFIKAIQQGVLIFYNVHYKQS